MITRAAIARYPSNLTLPAQRWIIRQEGRNKTMNEITMPH